MKNTYMHSKNDDLDIGNNIHVLGCGATGISVIKFLTEKGYTVFAHDESDIPKDFSLCKELVPEENLRLGKKCYQDIDSADTLIVSPGFSLKQEFIKKAIDSGVEVIGDIDLFMRLNQKPIILITGSNGKSTVSALLGEVLNRTGNSAVVCGNYGLPVLDALATNADYYIVEISSFQLETTPNIHSTASVVLNISEDHMDRYDSFDEYYQTKLHVYKNTKHKIINLDEKYAKEITCEKSDVTISMADRACNFCITTSDSESYITHNGIKIAQESDFKLIGKHNIFNIAVVLAIAEILGIEIKHALPVVKDFTGLEHRTEFVADINGVIWINDSKATNVGATIAAISGISSPIILILGGIAKDAKFTELCKYLNNKVKKVIVFGQDKKQIINDIRACVDFEEVDDINEVVKKAAELALRNDVVLFSPSCASFDMFDNYQHRGNVFKELVHMEGLNNA